MSSDFFFLRLFRLLIFLSLMLGWEFAAGPRLIKSASVVFSRIPAAASRTSRNTLYRALWSASIDQNPQLLRVPKRRERPVNQTDDFAQPDLRRRPAQAVSALGAAHALHDARVLQFQKNQLQKLSRQIFFVGNVANPD